MAPARPVRNLSCDDSFREAAGKIIWTRFEEMVGFQEAALAGVDIEGVHDMRVASRRLRAALELFSDAFPAKRLKPLLREVKNLADALGDVRDRDVLIERLQGDMAGRPRSERLALSAMIHELQEERTIARQVLRRTMGRLEKAEFRRRFLAVIAQETM